MAHITCNNCGEVFEDQEFCPRCGQWVGPLPESRYEEFALDEQTPEEPLPSLPPSRQETLSCPSCGAANPSTNRHCEQCGARLSQGPLPVAPQPIIRTTAGARALVIILGTIAVVALLAFLVNSIFGGKNGTATQSTTTSTSTTALPTAVDIPVITETCSSELNDKFSCAKLFDDDPETYWNDASAKGVGAAITVTFPQAYKLTQIIFTNVADDTKFKMNYKVKGYEITLDDAPGAPVIGSLNDSNARPQGVLVDSLGTTQVTITITSTYPSVSVDGATPYNELALAGIQFVGRPAG
ncbi:MAG: discoidin domain-containing protein [Acidimicrobiia bacterium]